MQCTCDVAAHGPAQSCYDQHREGDGSHSVGVVRGTVAQRGLLQHALSCPRAVLPVKPYATALCLSVVAVSSFLRTTPMSLKMSTPCSCKGSGAWFLPIEHTTLACCQPGTGLAQAQVQLFLAKQTLSVRTDTQASPP